MKCGIKTGQELTVCSGKSQVIRVFVIISQVQSEVLRLFPVNSSHANQFRTCVRFKALCAVVTEGTVLMMMMMMSLSDHQVN